MEGILSPETLQITVSEAYASLYAAMASAADAARDRRAADEVVTDTRDAYLRSTDPKELGANEAARTAALNNFLCGERENARKAAEAEAAAVHSLRLAEKRVEEARCYLTIARIAAGLPERSH